MPNLAACLSYLDYILETVGLNGGLLMSMATSRVDGRRTAWVDFPEPDLEWLSRRPAEMASRSMCHIVRHRQADHLVSRRWACGRWGITRYLRKAIAEKMKATAAGVGVTDAGSRRWSDGYGGMLSTGLCSDIDTLLKPRSWTAPCEYRRMQDDEMVLRRNGGMKRAGPDLRRLLIADEITRMLANHKDRIMGKRSDFVDRALPIGRAIRCYAAPQRGRSAEEPCSGMSRPAGH